MPILMSLGPHKFTIEDLNYQRLVSDYEARWKEHHTAGGGQIDHFLGGNATAITISGVLFPESYGGLGEAEALGQAVLAGKPLPFYSLAGKTFGKVKLLSLSLGHENIGPDNRVIEATYDLKVSQYKGGTDRNKLLGQAGSLVSRAASGVGQAVSIARTLF